MKTQVVLNAGGKHEVVLIPETDSEKKLLELFNEDQPMELKRAVLRGGMPCSYRTAEAISSVSIHIDTRNLPKPGRAVRALEEG
jgi:hypothetical protein